MLWHTTRHRHESQHLPLFVRSINWRRWVESASPHVNSATRVIIHEQWGRFNYQQTELIGQSDIPWPGTAISPYMLIMTYALHVPKSEAVTFCWLHVNINKSAKYVPRSHRQWCSRCNGGHITCSTGSNALITSPVNPKKIQKVYHMPIIHNDSGSVFDRAIVLHHHDNLNTPVLLCIRTSILWQDCLFYRLPRRVAN